MSFKIVRNQRSSPTKSFIGWVPILNGLGGFEYIAHFKFKVVQPVLAVIKT